ncbi:MAG: small multi-drug export protein [Armatimonadetes bacterium]|nr:small multi-drug export protein [Armatimonadota bacterium]
MSEHLQHLLNQAGVPPLAIVALLSALPISEVRGGIPVGYALHLPLWEILAVAIPANVIAVIPVVLWFEPAARYLGDKPVIGRFIRWLLRRARKREEAVRKYGVFAVTIFIAVPLPMTGAWTGAIVASVFGLGFWRSLVCVILGVCIASVIVTLACAGVIGLGGFLVPTPGVQ